MIHPIRLVSLAVLLVAGSLLAHGGQYRGPVFPVRLPPGGGAGVPGTPGGPRVPTAAPTTGARDLVPSANTWQTWWEFNKEPYLKPRIALVQAPITGSDDYYLGARKTSGMVDVLAPTKEDRVDRVVPAIHALMEADDNRDIQTASLVALGKVGLDAPGIEIEKVIAERISRGNQEVRETAVLALGVAGRRKAVPILSDLLRNTPAGRKLAERSEEVRTRTRAFAAYGLGLLARRVGDADLSQQIHDMLWATLEDDDVKHRELRTAIVSALGILRADPSNSADKRLGWVAAMKLTEWFQRDLGKTAENVQAHAAIAAARILGRGTTSTHRRCKQLFMEQLMAKKRRGPAILQSCAVALGILAVSPEASPADEPFSKALQRYWAKGRDQTARQLGAISLGRIGGDSNREWLAQTYNRANKSIEQPWLALALGVLIEPRGSAGYPDRAIADMLLDDLIDAATDDRRSALAVAVGLSGYQEATVKMMELLRDNEGDPRSAGYLAIGLGLLRDDTATSQLTSVLERSTRRPFVLQQCAVALGCIGDHHTNGVLVRMLVENDSAAVLAAIASALGRIGDRRSIDALITASQDKGLTKLARAFVAAALGGVADKDELPWNVPLSVDCNYATDMDTLTNGATGVLDIL